jgi:hypothetical protein
VGQTPSNATCFRTFLSAHSSFLSLDFLRLFLFISVAFLVRNKTYLIIQGVLFKTQPNFSGICKVTKNPV